MDKTITLTGKSLEYLLIILSSEKEYLTSQLAGDIYKQLNHQEVEPTNNSLLGGHVDEFVKELKEFKYGQANTENAKVIRFDRSKKKED